MKDHDVPMDAFGPGAERLPAPTTRSHRPHQRLGAYRGEALRPLAPDLRTWAESLRPPPDPPVVEEERAAPPARLPRRPRAVVAYVAIVEVGVALAFYQWYAAARHWATGSDAAALANALRLIEVEDAFGFFNEAALQQRVLSVPWFVEVVAAHYALLHFAVPVTALVVMFRRDRARYYVYRRAFAWMSALAVTCFWLWPLMPPRLLPASYGFVDVMAHVARLPAVDSGFAPALYNGVAAMPSLHVGYALWSAVAAWPVVSRRGRAAVAGHLVVTLGAVVITGNHFHLDAVGAAAVLGLAIALAHHTRFPRVAPTHVCVATALIAAAAVIWLPKGLLLLAAEDLLLAATVLLLARTLGPSVCRAVERG